MHLVIPIHEREKNWENDLQTEPMNQFNYEINLPNADFQEG